jgi:transcriptional regulator with XRE-family HTH domain
MATRAVGELLRHWRKRRRMSQMELALEAEISSRHLSFIETGRSKPGRDVVLVLASALEVPLRERNLLLAAAGHAPAYRETSLDDAQMESVRRALGFLMERHEPYPAVVLDPWWNVLMSNEAILRLSAWLLGVPLNAEAFRGLNLLRAMFDPQQLRPYIANFDVAAPLLLARVNRDAVFDERAQQLLEELRAYPDLPPDWREPLLDTPRLLIPLELYKDDQRVALFSTITTLGTAQDITLQEIRVETFFPADDASDRALRRVSAGVG